MPPVRALPWRHCSDSWIQRRGPFRRGAEIALSNASAASHSWRHLPPSKRVRCAGGVVGGFGWHAPSLYPPAAGGGQVFERLFVQSQLLGLLALFCFLDVSHIFPSYLLVVKSTWCSRSTHYLFTLLVRSIWVPEGQASFARKLRVVKSGQKVVEHSLMRAMVRPKQPIRVHVNIAACQFMDGHG